MKNMQITRRKMMAMSASALLLADVWPGALAAEQTDGKPFEFFIVNDLHYIRASAASGLRRWWDRCGSRRRSRSSALSRGT